MCNDETVNTLHKTRSSKNDRRRGYVYGVVMSTSSPSSKIFAQRLRIARETRELSQSELAKRANLQASAVSHFETGGRRPSFRNLKRLADALQVSTDYLLGRTESLSVAVASSDVLFRNISQLSADDREFIETIVSARIQKAKDRSES